MCCSCTKALRAAGAVLGAQLPGQKISLSYHIWTLHQGLYQHSESTRSLAGPFRWGLAQGGRSKSLGKALGVSWSPGFHLHPEDDNFSCAACRAISSLSLCSPSASELPGSGTVSSLSPLLSTAQRSEDIGLNFFRPRGGQICHGLLNVSNH